jgi:hypothetical protein
MPGGKLVFLAIYVIVVILVWRLLNYIIKCLADSRWLRYGTGAVMLLLLIAAGFAAPSYNQNSPIPPVQFFWEVFTDDDEDIVEGPDVEQTARADLADPVVPDIGAEQIDQSFEEAFPAVEAIGRLQDAEESFVECVRAGHRSGNPSQIYACIN